MTAPGCSKGLTQLKTSKYVFFCVGRSLKLPIEILNFFGAVTNNRFLWFSIFSKYVDIDMLKHFFICHHPIRQIRH